MSLKSLFNRGQSAEDARAVYDIVTAQARRETFYRDLSVPDTVDGRFEMLTLHMFLVLRRLKSGPDKAEGFSQRLFDFMFDDMDASLREMGAGDMGVGKRVKSMVEAFYGRVSSYETALSEPGDGLERALERNLYRSDAPAPDTLAALAAYVRGEDSRLADIETDRIAAADFDFGDPLGDPAP